MDVSTHSGVDRVVRVRVHDEPEGLWAECPGLPGVYASGQTRDHVERDMRAALDLALSGRPYSIVWIRS